MRKKLMVNQMRSMMNLSFFGSEGVYVIRGLPASHGNQNFAKCK